MEYKIIDKATKQFLLLVLLLIGCAMQVQAQNAKRHEVKAGETLYGISRAYGLSESEIKAANPSINAEGTIMAGQVLVIPEKKSSVQTSITPVQANEVVADNTPVADDTPKYKLIYTVKKKETLYSISKQFGVTMDEIIAINPDINPEYIHSIELGWSKQWDGGNSANVTGYYRSREDVIDNVRVAYEPGVTLDSIINAGNQVEMGLEMSIVVKPRLMG